MGPVHAPSASPFLQCGMLAKEKQLAVLHLKRDLLIPTVLQSEDAENEGYNEGKVTNTRFGSFPHVTLIDVPWGSQVRASAVDTGSRGRRGDGPNASKKRKREAASKDSEVEVATTGDLNATSISKIAQEAASGFIHLLPPTPEIWTASLPHRTQVVYTPDYSYILHRIRARPGTRLIEAGAGSGSFTHAAARAVFNDYNVDGESTTEKRRSKSKTRTFEDAKTGEPDSRGKVWSFEFHEQRAQKLKQEITEHGLDGLVQLTHRDVCQEGFIPDSISSADMKANAVFLDLPAPWLALEHLTRNRSHPLDPNTAVHICTFSPCIEQIQKTISTLRKSGWLEIEMVEVAAKRIEVRRERVGLQEEGLRGVNDSPATVDEALTRLREVEGKSKGYHAESRKDANGDALMTIPVPQQHVSKQQRLQNIREAQETRKLYKEGRLITKAEPELKMHTSYLVFAILPRLWTEEDEKAAQMQTASGLPANEPQSGSLSQRRRKQAAKDAAGGNKAVEMEREENARAEAT